MTTARAVFRLQTPSGGDWAVERVAALQLRWTEGASITRNHFHHLDGTALLLSGANSGAKIIGNEFAWLGQSAIVAWGELDRCRERLFGASLC